MNLIKRDPIGHREEFLQQWTHYESIRKIFETNPDEQSQHFREIVTFIAQVAQCYPNETADFPKQISSLLLENYGSLSPDTRKSLVSNLVLLRNKNVVTSVDLLRSLFPLLPRTTSPLLRTFIRKTILSDIRTANLRTKNHKLNRAVQAMLFGMVERGMESEVVGDKGKSKAGVASNSAGAKHASDEAMWAVVLTKELWKKGVWNDAKPVSIVSMGCFHPVMKVQSASIHFFLGGEEEESPSDEEDDDLPDIKTLRHRHEINKKSRANARRLSKDLKAVKKRTPHVKPETTTANFPALQMLNDPQTFAEKLFDTLNRYDKRFSLDHKILIMQLLSRTMAMHQLCVLSFYSYVIKYLRYHQLRIPAILVSLAQSVHELTPPDVLTPVIRKITQEFVHPGVGSEVIAAGLNGIREICRRQPWCMEQDLLEDLIAYRKSKDKGIITAARGLLQLFREVNPGILKRRERGKEANMGMKNSQPLPFGHHAKPAEDIEGLTLLEEHLSKLQGVASSNTAENPDDDVNDDDEGDWDGWEVASDSAASSSSSEGWLDVESDGEQDFSISDSDEEGDSKKKGEPADEPAEADAPSEPPPAKVSTLATTKILTPADYHLLNDLRIKAAQEAVESGGGKAVKRKLAALEAGKKSMQQPGLGENTFMTEDDILGPRKKAKADYEERMASIQKGREGRERYGSSKGKKKKDAPSSSTNREKARNKPIMMILSSGAVRGKKKASLRDKQKRLRAHIVKNKKSHH